MLLCVLFLNRAVKLLYALCDLDLDASSSAVWSFLTSLNLGSGSSDDD